MSQAPEPDAEWNAGHLGCGDLVLELMIRMKTMAPGQLLKLVALDPGAPADIPAWCRMTGQEFVRGEDDEYDVRRVS